MRDRGVPLPADATGTEICAEIQRPPIAAFALLYMSGENAGARARHLSNDARNIDDVQVAFEGAGEQPADETLVVDA